MFLSTLKAVTYLSSRYGLRKDGGNWYSVVVYDDRGTAFTLFFSSSVEQSAIDLLDDLTTGCKINLLLECNPSFDGKSFRITIKDMQISA